MGVPRLFPWLRQNFPRAVKHFQHGEGTFSVDYLYLDANGLLHGAAQNIYHYGSGSRMIDRYRSLSDEAKMKRVFAMFFENIIQVTGVMRPKKVLYIAIDGPAPLAKQNQQRERRFVAAKNRLEEEKGSGQQRFDSNSITPGTLFMHRLTQYINYAIRKEMNSYFGWRDIKVIFSPPTVPGEGEHKIMDYIRDLPREEQVDSSHCLFGPDGDLIMLGLSAHLPKMQLFREDQYNVGYYHLLDMSRVRRELPRILGQRNIQHSRESPREASSSTSSQQNRTLDNVTDDFIVAGFFVGNDFLPKIQMFHLLEEGLEFMLNAYAFTSGKGTKNPLTLDGNIHLEGFQLFIQEIAKSEDKFLLDQITTKNHKKLPPEPKFVNKTLKDAITETLHPGNKDPDYHLNMVAYRKGYYAKCFNTEYESSDFEGKLKKMCEDYLRSFVWVFWYYVRGLPAWRWAYEHHYAPLMADFNRYLQSLTDKDMTRITSFKMQSASFPFEQLLSVLPPSSANLLPSVYGRLMTSPKSPLVKEGYYPMDFKIDYEGKLKEYQGIALLPFVNYNEVHKNYEKMKKCCVKQKYIRNQRGRPVYFIYDVNYHTRFTSRMGNILHNQVRRIPLRK